MIGKDPNLAYKIEWEIRTKKTLLDGYRNATNQCDINQRKKKKVGKEGKLHS